MTACFALVEYYIWNVLRKFELSEAVSHIKYLSSIINRIKQGEIFYKSRILNVKKIYSKPNEKIVTDRYK